MYQHLLLIYELGHNHWIRYELVIMNCIINIESDVHWQVILWIVTWPVNQAKTNGFMNFVITMGLKHQVTYLLVTATDY